MQRMACSRAAVRQNRCVRTPFFPTPPATRVSVFGCTWTRTLFSVLLGSAAAANTVHSRHSPFNPHFTVSLYFVLYQLYTLYFVAPHWTRTRAVNLKLLLHCAYSRQCRASSTASLSLAYCILYFASRQLFSAVPVILALECATLFTRFSHPLLHIPIRRPDSCHIHCCHVRLAREGHHTTNHLSSVSSCDSYR